ncbi:LysR family transcriptional regulator [Aquabacterium humicola]|uniref:LysR family transcriptional regulator n=1 Tax=Aquabacterium humicola TaxID=3237377 RepID=UPI0025428BE4|nr:LysR family transcriptional regulator [Rubrivivax pictus]
MDLRHLRYFVAVAEEGHMTRAAAKLGIQQPPLSQQIKALETMLGLPLLLRHPKGVSLTDGGRLFLAEARRLLEDVDAMRHRMALVARGVRGVLSVGFTSSAATHALTPRTLRACRTRYPDIELELHEHNAAEITEALVAGRLHCGFLRVPVARPPGLRFDTLLDEPAVLAVPADHALGRVRSKRTPVPLKALHGERLILVRRPNAPGLYANLLAACARAGVEPVIVAEVDRMVSNLNLVASGEGLSIVPASMKGTHAQSVVFRPLDPKLKLDAPLTLAYREIDAATPGPAASFIGMVAEVAAAHRRGEASAARR